MKKNIFTILLLAISSAVVFGQGKGVDSQTKQIRTETDKATSRPHDGGRTWDFGKGKTKVRLRLENPQRLTSRRDVLVENVIEILKEKKIIVDEAASRLKDGFIVTQPYIFAKGSVTSRNELNRYAILPTFETAWTRGRYTLTIDIQTLDGMQNNVSVNAKIEGRSENGISSEWTTLQSSGSIEDEILVKLVEAVTGKSFEEPADNQ